MVVYWWPEKSQKFKNGSYCYVFMINNATETEVHPAPFIRK